jgi:hypothetical protein
MSSGVLYIYKDLNNDCKKQTDRIKTSRPDRGSFLQWVYIYNIYYIVSFNGLLKNQKNGTAEDCTRMKANGSRVVIRGGDRFITLPNISGTRIIN